MQVYIKTDGTVEITLTRDQFDILRGITDDFSVDHPDAVLKDPQISELIDWIADDDSYTYQVTEEVYEATESFINGLVDYYKDSDGVSEELLRQIIANATLNRTRD